MSEFNAALGLLQLKYMDQIIQKRKEIDGYYRKRLRGIKGVKCLANSGEYVSNYAYFPILINHEYSIGRDELYERMKIIGVHARRYFFPLISEFPMYSGLPSSRADSLPEAALAASRVLCLPIYPDLPIDVVEEICSFIAEQ
jgi:dTDP-4-amino-4,6-dideoxygalactose transaminase